MKVRLDTPRKGQTAKLLRMYLADRARQVARWYAGEYGFWDVPFDVFLQRIIWIGYGIALVIALLVSHKQGWAPGPITKTLVVGGSMLLIQAAVLFFHFLVLVWKDMVYERRSLKSDAPVSVGEILRREIDFERWCE